MLEQGLAKMSGDEAKELLVGLRTYQLTRLVRSQGEQRLHGLKEDLFSVVGQLVGRFDEKLSRQLQDVRERFDWKVSSLEQISAEERARVEGLDASELKTQLRHELAALVGERMAISGEALEQKIVAEVAAAYKIETSFRPLENVEREVFCHFMRNLAERVQNQLSQMKPEDLHVVHERLFENLTKLSEEEKETIKRDLGIAELSERQVLNVIRNEGPALVDRGEGYGAYLALMAATHAVFTTLAGIALPFALYSAMATLVGFLLGPLGFALITVGGGSYFFKKAQREYNAQLLALALVNLRVKDRWASV